MQKYQPRVIRLDMSRVPDMEYSALQRLIEGEQKLRQQGLELWLADLSPRVLEDWYHINSNPIGNHPGWTIARQREYLPTSATLPWLGKR